MIYFFWRKGLKFLNLIKMNIKKRKMDHKIESKEKC